MPDLINRKEKSWHKGQFNKFACKNHLRSTEKCTSLALLAAAYRPLLVQKVLLILCLSYLRKLSALSRKAGYNFVSLFQLFRCCKNAKKSFLHHFAAFSRSWTFPATRWFSSKTTSSARTTSSTCKKFSCQDAEYLW